MSVADGRARLQRVLRPGPGVQLVGVSLSALLMEAYVSANRKTKRWPPAPVDSAVVLDVFCGVGTWAVACGFAGWNVPLGVAFGPARKGYYPRFHGHALAERSLDKIEHWGGKS